MLLSTAEERRWGAAAPRIVSGLEGSLCCPNETAEEEELVLA